MRLKSLRNRIDVLYPKYSYMNRELTKQLDSLPRRNSDIVSLYDIEKLQYKEILDSIARGEKDDEIVSSLATHGWKNVHMEQYNETLEDLLDNIIFYTRSFSTFVGIQEYYKRGVDSDNNFILPLAIEYDNDIAYVYVYDPIEPNEELPHWNNDEISVVGVFLKPKDPNNYLNKDPKQYIKTFQSHIECTFSKRDKNRVLITKKGSVTIDKPLRELMQYMESVCKF